VWYMEYIVWIYIVEQDVEEKKENDEKFLKHYFFFILVDHDGK
jgi:hypothetical protein